jgi:predicted ATPase
MDLGGITLLIGPNNAGKSALLRAIYLIQLGASYTPSDNRFRGTPARVEVNFKKPFTRGFERQFPDAGVAEANDLKLELGGNPAGGNLSGVMSWNEAQSQVSHGQLRNTRPDHVIFPIFSRRKAARYEPTVGIEAAKIVGHTDQFLASRLSTLTGPHDDATRFRELLARVVGVEVNTFLAPQGHAIGQSITPEEHISLENMGEGISGVLALVSELASPGPRVFLMEEPETDLHPLALRNMLDLILEAVDVGSQFVVSTHSDIVLRYLGSHVSAKIYRVSKEISDSVPTTSFTVVEGAFERAEALANLGYFGTLPNSWLIFEESTAEQFVRDALIPLFTPELRGLTTIGARGAGNLPPIVNDLNRLVLFSHLDRTKPRAFVIADGDSAGRTSLEKLRESFPTWKANQFVELSKPGIENYYPSHFQNDVANLPPRDRKQERREAKGQLAANVVEWCLENRSQAQAELSVSGREILDWLESIRTELKDLWT